MIIANIIKIPQAPKMYKITEEKLTLSMFDVKPLSKGETSKQIAKMGIPRENSVTLRSFLRSTSRFALELLFMNLSLV